MKTNLLSLAAIFAIALFSNNVSAQAVVSNPAATASATIITPIAVSKSVDLNFGDISTNGQDGTVKIDNALIHNRTATGGASFSAANSGTVTSAKFTVTGVPGYQYSITIPTTVTLTHTDNTNSMVVSAIGNSVGSTGTLTAGTQDIYVGGTLNLVGAQVAGVYTNTTSLTVTVNYN